MKSQNQIENETIEFEDCECNPTDAEVCSACKEFQAELLGDEIPF